MPHSHHLLLLVSLFLKFCQPVLVLLRIHHVLHLLIWRHNLHIEGADFLLPKLDSSYSCRIIELDFTLELFYCLVITCLIWSYKLCLIAGKLIFLCYRLSHLSFRIQIHRLLCSLLGHHHVLLWLVLVLRLISYRLAGKTLPDGVGFSRTTL
jgi:hypothetical protein